MYGRALIHGSLGTITTLALAVTGTSPAQGTTLGGDPVTITATSSAAPDAPAATPSPSPASTPTSASTAAATSSPTSTPSASDTQSAPSTLASPSITVTAPTNCRTGPGLQYQLVYILTPGTTATLIGADPARGYWLITVPGSSGATCWLWGRYGLVTGDISSLPAAAVHTPPGYSYSLSEPKNLWATCSAESYADDGDDEENDIDDASAWTVILGWTNTEPNQQGVRVYRNNRRIATLTPGTRTFTDYFIHYDYYGGASYGVQAFNGNSVSAIVWTYMNSCH